MLDPLSPWSHIQAAIPEDQGSFTEFGEHDVTEASQPLHPSTSSGLPLSPAYPSKHAEIAKETMSSSTLSTTQKIASYPNCHKTSDSFSLINTESLQLCTEGLGSESSDYLEDSSKISSEYWKLLEKARDQHPNPEASRRTRPRIKEAFPPPISCIGSSGRLYACFTSYRHEGRLVLKETRIPKQEFLHASREDGRLKLRTVQPNSGFFDEEDDDNNNDDDSNNDDDDDKEVKEYDEDEVESLSGEYYSDRTSREDRFDSAESLQNDAGCL